VTCLIRKPQGDVLVNKYAYALVAQPGGHNMVNIVAPASEIENAKADQGIKVVGNVYANNAQEGEGEVTPCLTTRTVLGYSNPYGLKHSKGCVVAEHRSGEFREYEGECYTLQANSNGGGIHAPNIVVHCTQKRGADRPSLRHNKNAGGSGHIFREDGVTYCLDTGNNMAIEYCPKQIGEVGKGGQGNRIYDANGIAITQSAQSGGMGSKTGLYWVNTRLRKLTPRECARLQGFPDWFEFPVSDTQAYKQMGNAVTVNVVREIGKELLAYFNHAWRQ
jgi:site-specific DNA-cytosine methylase